MISPVDKRKLVLDALHQARLAPFLKATNDRQQDALRLYIWHLRLSSTVAELLGVVEVVLRNAIDRELCTWNTNQGESGSWLLDPPASPLRNLTNSKRPEAVNTATKALGARDTTHPRHAVAITHDDVLASVMFGMWKDLMPNHAQGANPTHRDNQNRKRMWDEALVHAFPHATDPDGVDTYWQIFRLHQLRNRVSHMDSLLGVDIKDRLVDINKLMDSIDPHVAEWVTSINRVSAVLKERPKLKNAPISTVPAP